jgi:hypothetical protein
MVDAGTVAAALSAAIETAKQVGGLAERAKDRKLNEHILDLQQRLIEVQGLTMQIMTDNEKLASRVRELEREKEIAHEMVLEHGMYWRVKEGTKEGPYCGVCLASDRIAVPLIEGLKGNFTCGKCKAQSHTPDAESGFRGFSRPSRLERFEP